MYFFEDIHGNILSTAEIRVKMAGGPHIFFNRKIIHRWWFENGNHTEPLNIDNPLIGMIINSIERVSNG